MAYSLSGNVLVTGGTGTLGRALLRTAKAQNWNVGFTVYSRSEFLQAQMRRLYPEARYILGDVRDVERLKAAVAGHTTVIHAAAMKRLPDCEKQPGECFETNVRGTWNVLNACQLQGVEECLCISTDKACRAITAYGASKLYMERLVQAQAPGSTRLHLVRYGNVVASRGSVVPIWREQVATGKPLTITDISCTRFWLGESEMIQILLRALQQVPGAILIPKLSALGLADLARMLHPDAELEDIGLRSLEKRHEDLVHTEERIIETDGDFIQMPEGGLNHVYTSQIAPRVREEEFLRMLREAEESEKELLAK
jgi:UDP-N-acetylglucosamine 4,6-dehydratase